MTRRPFRETGVNPYIAFSDVLINLLLVFTLLLPLVLLLGSRGWDDVRYKSYQQRMETAIRAALSESERPVRQNRHDAPGEQRWIFTKTHFFRPDAPSELSEEGKHVLRKFAAVLNQHPDLWWRIRVEAHAPHDSSEEEGCLRITAERAVAVSAFLFKDQRCGIPPWKLTTSGRGYQDLLYPKQKTSQSNERIDLLLIPPPLDAAGKVPSLNP